MEKVENETEEQINSFNYAFQGLVHVLKRGRNFRLQALFGLLVILLAWLVDFELFEWAILIITISLVLTAELLNTVIELLVDLAVKEKVLPKAKVVKDVSAAFVLLLSIFALAIGLILFIPHFWELIYVL